MNPRLLELALKKQRLVLQSEELRNRLAAAGGAWKPVFSVGDRLRQAAQWLRRHPPVVLAALVGLFVARPRAVLRIAGRAWLFWRTLRRLRAGAHEAIALAGKGLRHDG